MKILLDTHSFLWFIDGNEKLSPKARITIEHYANQLFLSPASLWEMAIKISLGKLILSQPYENFITQQLEFNRIHLLTITIHQTALLTSMPFHHRDPFDRLIVAQVLAEQIPMISGDTIFDAYGVIRIW